MLRFRPLPILTVSSIAAFALLLTLGGWQWARFEDKVRARDVAPPTIEAQVDEGPRGPLQLVYAVLDGQAGWRILAPLPDGPDTVLFVDAGFAPGLQPPDRDGLKTPAIAPNRPLRGVRVTPSPPGPFAAKADPARGVWYAIDLPAMARAAGYANAKPYLLAAPYVGVDGKSRPNPFAHAVDPLPPERHVGYAITWWGLAVGLVGVYLLMHVRAGRLVWERR